MAWTTPKIWTAGERVTGPNLNAYVRDNLKETLPGKAQAAGDVFYSSGANAISRLAVGTAGHFLRVNSGATALEWAALAADRYLAAFYLWPHSTASAFSTAESAVSEDMDLNYMGVHSQWCGTLNDYMEWYPLLRSGTYKLTVIYETIGFAGIQTWKLNGTTIATIDGYAASPARNNRSTTTGITVSTSGQKTFRLEVASKNASSTGYWVLLAGAALVRTGA